MKLSTIGRNLLFVWRQNDGLSILMTIVKMFFGSRHAAQGWVADLNVILPWPGSLVIT